MKAQDQNLVQLQMQKDRTVFALLWLVTVFNNYISP